MIFETHAHYDDDRFDEDRQELLASLPEAGIGVVINCGASAQGNYDTIALAQQYAHVYGALGVHPSNIVDMNEEFFAWIKENASYDMPYEEIAAQFGVHGKQKESFFENNTIYRWWATEDAYVQITFTLGSDGTELWNVTQYDGIS